MEYDLVMHRPAEQRVRVANESGMRCGFCANIEQCLESTGRAVEKQRTNGSVFSGQVKRPAAEVQTFIIIHVIFS